MIRWVVKAGASSLDDLASEEVAVPSPGPGEVRIKMHAVSLNARDQLILSGNYGKAERDFVALADGAGEIDAFGEGVERWSIGDRVVSLYFGGWPDGPAPNIQNWGLGSPGEDGVLAEYVVLKADRVAPAPTTLTFEEAACLPCAALTAWTSLNGDRPYHRPLRKEDRVLATGTGGVSLFALLLAKAAGAEVVVTSSSDDKAALAVALGASGTVNYVKSPQWGEAATRGGRGFDKVVNSAGSGVLDDAIAALAPGGEIALMGLFASAESPPNFLALMGKGGSIRGTAVGSASAYSDMAQFIDEKGVKPPIAETFPLTGVKAAYQALASGQCFGKIVIRIVD